jgi:uncharacterized protein
MHMYTHNNLWPALSDLAEALGAHCVILDNADSGAGVCFDEASSTPWAVLQQRFPGFPIPMACHTTTVELRGELDVRMGTTWSHFLLLFICLHFCALVQ